MQKAILTLSKNTSLIEHIRSNLEEGGRYYVQGVTSAHGSLAMVRHRLFDLAILDLDQSDLTAAQLVYNLRKIQPEIKILIFAPENDAGLVEIRKLPLDGVLRKPFFAPELSDMLKTLFRPPAPEDVTFSSEALQKSIASNWEDTLEESHEEMSLLLAQTSAVSSMIFHKGDLVSQSAGVPAPEAQRVTDYVGKNWRTFKNFEVCHFMREEADLDAVLVYALPLGGETLLVFTYPANADLSMVRSETSRVRDAYMIGRYSKPKSDGDRSTLSVSQLLHDDGSDLQAGSFADMSDADTEPEPIDADQSQWILEFDGVDLPTFSAPQASLADTQPIPVVRTELQPGSEANGMSVIEPVNGAVHVPSETAVLQSLDEEPFVYHCLIVPRDPGQFLTRKLGEVSAASIREKHHSQGWKIIHLTIRPQYALWTVRLPACTSPVHMVEAVKEATSDQLKSHFAGNGSSGDSFWAPGYWILSGDQPPSSRLIQQFLGFRRQKITQTPNTR